MTQTINRETGQILEDTPTMDALGILARLGNGHLIDDLAETLAVVAAEVVETGEKGSVTLKLEVSNQNAGDVMVVIADQIARKPPVRKPRGQLLFAVGGGLHTSDPRQTRLDFRDVSGPAADVRQAAEGGASVREV